MMTIRALSRRLQKFMGKTYNVHIGACLHQLVNLFASSDHKFWVQYPQFFIS